VQKNLFDIDDVEQIKKGSAYAYNAV